MNDSGKTVEILLDHFGFDLNEMRQMDEEMRSDYVYMAAKQVEYWLWCNFEKMSFIFVCHRILKVLVNGR